MNKKITTWNEFINFIFRLSNTGVYVRWTASDHNDGRKSIWLMTPTPITENAPLWNQMKERGFTCGDCFVTDKLDCSVYQFISLPLHEPTKL